MIYETPTLTGQDRDVLTDLARMEAELAAGLGTPHHHWVGRLRRTSVARAIRGSSSIAGYPVELDDADAALDEEAPIGADTRTYREILGYRQALLFVLATASDPQFAIDASTIRAMHYMMVSHALDQSPGRFRGGEVFVSDEASGRRLYRGPEPRIVPGLVDELAATLRHDGNDPFVRAAMAHLNFAMIYPFRGGNGRMARALHTTVLAHAGIAAPELSSIDEWLGAHPEEYSRAFVRSTTGSWSPRHDSSLWVSFMLRAHHLQAQVIRHRLACTAAQWQSLEAVVAAHGLPDRTLDALYAAALGMRVRRSSYLLGADIDERTGSRDLRALVDSGLLVPVGSTTARHYRAGRGLTEIAAVCRRPPSLADPYPGFRARLFG